MNKIFRSIYNESLNAWVAVSEIEGQKGKSVNSVDARTITPARSTRSIFKLAKVLSVLVMAFGGATAFAQTTIAPTTNGYVCTTPSTVATGSLDLANWNCLTSDNNGSVGLITFSGTYDQAKAFTSGLPNGSVSVGDNARAKTSGSIAIGSAAIAGKPNNYDILDWVNSQSALMDYGLNFTDEAALEAYVDAVQVKKDTNQRVSQAEEFVYRSAVGHSNNIAIGLGAETAGGRNISIGEYAGGITTSITKTGQVRDDSGYNHFAVHNVNIGSNAGTNNQNVDYSVAIGYQAGFIHPTSAAGKAAAENQAKVKWTGHGGNVLIGKQAGYNSAPFDNVAIGAGAGQSISDQHNRGSVFIGNQAGSGSNSGVVSTVVDSNNPSFVFQLRDDGRLANPGGPIIAGANTAVGPQAFRGGSGSGNTALGRYAMQGAKGGANTALGEGAFLNGDGDLNVVIGALAGSYNSKAYRSVSVGAVSYAYGYGSVALGATSKAGFSDKATEIMGGVAIGDGAKSFGDAAIALGRRASASTENEMADSSIAIGSNATARGKGSIALGGSTDVTTELVPNEVGHGAKGYGANIDKDIPEATKNPVANADFSIALGTASVAGTTTADENAIAIGKGAQALAKDSIAIGTGNVVRGMGSGAIGDPSIIDGATSYSVGNNNRISAATSDAFALGNEVYLGTDASGSTNVNVSGAVALGNRSGVTVAGGAALGSQSVASTDKDVAGYDVLTDTASQETSSTWKSTAAAVSVGDSAQITRQITNVAAGFEDTDAVNVAQLKKIRDFAGEGLSLPITFEGNTGSVARKLGETLRITGEGTQGGNYSGHNLKTVVVNNDVQIQMTDMPTFGDITINVDGRITGVAPGKDGTDVVNVDQLTEATYKGWTLSTNNGTVTDTVNSNDTVDLSNTDGNIVITQDEKNVVFNLANDLTADSLTINNGGPVINVDGINMNNKKIINLAAGTNPTDAVNVSQLTTQKFEVIAEGLNFAANEGGDVHRDLGETLAIKGLASTAGEYSGNNLKTVTSPNDGTIQLQMAESPKFGNITINVDGRITGVAPGIDGTDVVNVDQLNEVINIANTGWNLSTNTGAVTEAVKPGNTVDLSNADGNIVIAQEGTNVTFDLSKDLTADSITINNGGPVINQGGINMNETRITNMGDAINDSDAVTYRQLKSITVGKINLDFAGNEGEFTAAAGSTVNIKGGDKRAESTYSTTNVTTVADGNEVSILMADAPIFTGEVKADGGINVSKHFTVNEGTTINMGGNKVTNVADGQISKDSKDAVNGSQIYNLAQNIGGQINNIRDDLNKVDRNARAGSASAGAIASLPQAYLPGKSMFAVATAGYRGQQGYAAGLSTVSDNGKWIIKGAVSGNSRGHVMYGVGAGYQW